MGFLFEITIPVLILITSIIGNILVIVVWSFKRFHKTASINILRADALFQILSTLQMIPHLINGIIHIELPNLTEYSCKILKYFEYALPSISANLLVLISIDRVCKIIFPSKQLLKNSRSQMLTIGTCIVINLLLYSLYIVGYGLIEINEFSEGNIFLNE